MKKINFNYIERIKKLKSIVANNQKIIFSSRDHMTKGDDIYFHSQDSMMTYFFSNNEHIKHAIISFDKNLIYLDIIVEKRSKVQEKFEGKINTKEIKELFSSEIAKVNILFEEDIMNQLKTDEHIEIFKCIEPKKEYFSNANKFILNIELELKISVENKFDEICELRVIKDEDEIQAIKEANSIAKKTFEYMLSKIKTADTEQELFAHMSYKIFEEFSSHAFYPIIGAGKNACTLHYKNHNSKINENDLILFDFGCEFQEYKSDISRTIPKSKTFSIRQKEVYEAVLRIQEYAFSQIIIGEGIKEYELKVVEKVGKELVKLNLLTQKQIDEDNSCIRIYYPHRCSHFLGLDTHDCGNYLTTFKQGMVLTVEPGIYIEEENIGIRIEDNIVIREKDKGVENLSKEIIKSVEDIEECMRKF